MPFIVDSPTITDALRALGVSGDGRSNDSSMGVWEATANVCTNGGFETNLTGWSASGATPTRDTAIFKFGAASAKLVTNGAGSGEGYTWTPAGALTGFAAAGPGSVGAWVKAPNGATMQLQLIAQSAGNSNLGTTTKTFTGTGAWQYVSVSNRTLPTGTDRAAVAVLTNGAQAITFNIDGVMLEALAVPSPYAPDGTSRAAGRVQAPASLLSASQGWISFRVRPEWASSALPGHGFPALFEWAVDDNNRLVAWYNAGVWTFRRVSGGTITQITAADTLAAGVARTVTVAWDAVGSGRVRISIAGGGFTQTVGLNVPNLSSKTTWDILSAPANGTYQFDGEALWVVVGTGVPSDADAATLNSFGDTDPTPGALPAAPIALWTASTAAFTSFAADTAVAMSDAVVRRVTHKPSDTGLTAADSVKRTLVSRVVADTSQIVSDTVSPNDAPAVRAISDVGATISDGLGVIGNVFALIGSDLYADGTTLAFGGFSTLDKHFTVFADGFEPYAPPPRETEAYYSHLPFLEAERKFGETSPTPGSGRRVSCAWHGLTVDPDRGAVVLVRDGGELDGLIGERVRITPVGKPGSSRSPVYAFVHGKATLDAQDELSVPRRVFLTLGVLGLDRMPVLVETLK